MSCVACNGPAEVELTVATQLSILPDCSAETAALANAFMGAQAQNAASVAYCGRCLAALAGDQAIQAAAQTPFAQSLMGGITGGGG